jgi:DNA-binding PadR family transcriptional regulator
MASLFRFGSKNGKKRGLLALFILHSLHQAPKSGYALIKEIAEKTKGHWIPSKGTLYPLLQQMEKDQLITGTEAGPRSRKNYGLTVKGEATLSQIKKRGRESHQKMTLYKGLIHDIFHSEPNPEKNPLVRLEMVWQDIPQENRDRGEQILTQCLNQLKGLIP